jgi:hypothetical protein
MNRAPILAKSIKEALANYLKGRRLAQVQIRNVEGSKVEGFLWILGGEADRRLVDFKATSTPQGGLSSLEVGGKKISLIVGTRGARD